MPRRVLGFDIDAYAMKIAVCDKDRNLVDFITADLPDNMMRNGHYTSPNAMGDFIKETLRTHHIRGGEACVSLSDNSYFLKRVRLPKMTTEQLAVNLPFEFHDYISGETTDYVYDYAVLSMNDKEMELMAATTAKDTIEVYTRIMRRAGLKLTKLVPGVLGLQSILLPVPDKKREKAIQKQKAKLEREAAKQKGIQAREQARKEREEKKAEKKTKTPEEIAAELKAAAEKEDQEAAAAEKAEAEKEQRALADEAASANADGVPVQSGKGQTDALPSSSGGAGQTDALLSRSGGEGADPKPLEGDGSAQGTQDGRPQDYAVLDITHDGCQFHFFSFGSFEITRDMNTGMKDVIQAIMDSHGVERHIADLMMQHNQDHVLEEPDVGNILDNMTTEIMRVINFYNYNNAQNNIDQLLYCGGGIPWDHLLPRIREATGLPLKPVASMIPNVGKLEDVNVSPQAYGVVVE